MKSKALAALAFCLMFMVFISPARAAGPAVLSVEISPENPEVWDDLTCMAEFWDGDSDLEEARFKWYRNTVLIRTVYKSLSGSWDTEHDTLSKSLTKEGDQIRCRVDVRDSEVNSDYEDITVHVQETSQNNPPVIQGIPDQTTEIGEGVVVDLWDYAYDIEDSDTELDFSLDYAGNSNIIECMITGDRNVWCDEAKQLGESALTVRVTDTGGAWDTDTFVIRVAGECPFCDNKPPEIESIDIDPSHPDDRDDITCGVHVEDEDGNLDSVEFRWYVDGDLERTRIRDVSGYSDAAEDTLDSYETDEGDEVECRATVEDKDGKEDHASISVEVEENGGDCRIEVYDLDVEDEEDITFRIRNRGDDDVEVEYKIYVDDDRVEHDEIDIDEEDSERIEFKYDDFEGGEEYEIRVWAEADCGDTDEEEVTYTILDGEDCRISIYDLDVEGDEDITFRIRNRGDDDVEVEYRIYVDGRKVEEDDIDIDEGDSERIRYEYDDFEEGETYKIRVRAEADCGDTDEETETIIIGEDCDPGYLNIYRCYGNWLQKRYRTYDCDLVWKNWQYCSQGCSGSRCIGVPGPGPSPGCSLTMENLEYSQTVAPGHTGFVRATVRNTGSYTEDFRMEFYLDGTYLGRKVFTLGPGSAVTRIWNFAVFDGGKHTIRASVSSDCGASDSREVIVYAGAVPGPVPSVCNYNQVCEPGETWQTCPYDCPKPGPEPAPTEVEIRPASMDVNLYKSKVISINIHSYVKQDFTISVEGVPQGWLNYKQTVNVEGDRTSYVFISPKETGSYTLVVRVVAVTEGLTFTKGVDVFVAQADSHGAQPGDGITGALVAIASNIYTIILIIVIAAALLAWFGIRRLKSEDEATFEKR